MGLEKEILSLFDQRIAKLEVTTIRKRDFEAYKTKTDNTIADLKRQIKTQN